MLANEKEIKRKYLGKSIRSFLELPNLIDTQLNSYKMFLSGIENDKSDSNEEIGLKDVFESAFPIESPNGDMRLEFRSYSLDYGAIKFSEMECKKKGLSYAVPIKAEIDLVFTETHEIRRKEIYLGDIPLMTERGTFIVNGAERVVVAQIHRSPGVIFSFDKGVYSSRIIPYRGTWMEFEIDQKNDLIFVKLDRKKKILATMFLRAISFAIEDENSTDEDSELRERVFDSREKIIEAFYKTKNISLNKNKPAYDEIAGSILAKDVFVKDESGEKKKLYQAGSKIHLHNIDEMIQFGVKKFSVIDFEAKGSLNSQIIINCFAREEMKHTPDPLENDEPTFEDAISLVYQSLQPGNPMTIEDAAKDLESLYFSTRRYDLGRVGRYKINKKFDYNEDVSTSTLVPADITSTMKYLIEVYNGDKSVDDIDHLGNRRIRGVGEFLTTTLKTAFSRMARIASDRMAQKEMDTLKPQDLISIRPIVAALKEFFGSSQLSQFMDQVNPLAELTHKRRLSALGPGGLSRERAGFEVRDVHYTHYGRMCPVETPEGQNIGLIVSLANYARVNDYGFLEAPYVKVENGKVTNKVEYLTALDEDKYYIAQNSAALQEDGKFTTDLVSCRRQGDYTSRSPKDIQYMDVSPKQIVSVSASLIPFLEHDDANRTLMGSNMQRQGVPLLFPEPPRVGTGMEWKCAHDSGVIVKAKHAGTVTYVSSEKVVVERKQKSKDNNEDTYLLQKYQRTNQDTCYHQKPVVAVGDKINEGDAIADGPATYKGELALGRNILVGFVPWYGYNFEDAILISQRVVKEDMFTSIHIKEFMIEVRETKLGLEKLTADIPNKSEKSLDQLDAEGIIRTGAKVKSGDILVGKITPKSETDTTPEYKLLHSIFGEKSKDVRDSSLRVPHGIEGTVIDIQRLKRSAGNDLNPGVDEVVKVLIATKRKLREGDKMAGRHGNKGVVAKILPEEDMPYLEDGTSLDICLNPLGIPSRMNVGQILESELGLAGIKLDEWYELPVFQSPTTEQIQEKLKEAGLPTNSEQWVRDGLTGERFKNPIFVGVTYFMKLHHLVDDKMHARSTGPYSLVTQQPLGGKAQFGGQRLGEMEVWALEAYGAANTLQEFLTIKSDDMQGRSKIYEAIVKGEASTSAGIPESFNVLVQELRGLALDFKVYDSSGQPLGLTERDDEIIEKEKKGELLG